MRNGHTKGLLFFCLIFIKGCLAGGDIMMSEPVRAHLGQSASLCCKVNGEVHVVLAEWTRCNDSSTIAVFNPGEHSSDIKEHYTGHVSITEYHTLTINQVQDRDFGEYCCKVATFPTGSLEGRVHLLKDEEKNVEGGKEVDKPESPPAGLPVLMMVYITCGVAFVLTGIITALVCSKRRRKVRNPLHVIMTNTSLSPKQPSLLQKDPYTLSRTPSHAPRRDDDDDDDDDKYLNMKKT